MINSLNSKETCAISSRHSVTGHPKMSHPTLEEITPYGPVNSHYQMLLGRERHSDTRDSPVCRIRVPSGIIPLAGPKTFDLTYTPQNSPNRKLHNHLQFDRTTPLCADPSPTTSPLWPNSIFLNNLRLSMSLSKLQVASELHFPPAPLSPSSGILEPV